jgi:hypothetical protein
MASLGISTPIGGSARGAVSKLKTRIKAEHRPNMRYSGPQLLSSWLHVASAMGNQAASSLASSGRWAR